MNDVAGKSLLDLLWEHLDQFMDDLMAPAHEGGDLEQAELKGRAYGMAHAIALVTNPYHPDLDTVRADAVERWESRQADAMLNNLERQVDREERRLARRARRGSRNS